MSDISRPEPPRPLRFLFAVPVIGWIARDLWHDFRDNIWYLLVAVLSLWIIAISLWGLPALYIPMVLAAPLCLAMLVVLTRG